MSSETTIYTVSTPRLKYYGVAVQVVSGSALVYGIDRDGRPAYVFRNSGAEESDDYIEVGYGQGGADFEGRLRDAIERVTVLFEQCDQKQLENERQHREACDIVERVMRKV